MATKKKTIRQRPAPATTYHYLVLDKSGSMSHLTNKVRELYVQKVNDLFDSAEENGQRVRGSVLHFDSSLDVIVTRTDREGMLDPTVVNAYKTYGNTRLLDAVQKAIQMSEEITIRPQDAVLIEVITDGAENASTNMTKSALHNLIRDCQATDQYTFVFQVPPGYKARVLRDFPLLSSDNIREWEGTERGWAETHVATSQAYGSYMGARGQGLTQSLSFYKDIDASKIKKRDLSQLEDMSHRFKTFNVNNEMPISDFVESKTKKPYVTGSAFFQISKPETLRPGREVLISDKQDDRVYGGEDVRDLLGLPKNGEVEVNPLNLSTYNIYLQSASNNRKLVRGTKLLVDINKKKGSKATWGA